MRAGSATCRPPAARSPGSRPRSVRTCQGLRPRRVVQGLALTPPSMLPSAYGTASAPGMRNLSRLHTWPMHSPTDASPTPSRVPTHGSGPMWFAIPSSQWTLTTYSLPVFPAHTVKIRRDPGCTPDLADSRRRKRVARLPGVDEYEGRISHSCATYPLEAGIDGSSVIAFTPTIRRAHEGEAVAL